MGGSHSRQKGGRIERELVNLFKRIGYKAHRVPLSGAVPGYKSDVIVEIDGVEHSIEVKARGSQFNSVYAMLRELKTPHLGLCIDGTCIDIAFDIDAVLHSPGVYDLPSNVEGAKLPIKYMRTLRAMASWHKWLGEAGLLAIRGDREPFLFLRYRK